MAKKNNTKKSHRHWKVPTLKEVKRVLDDYLATQGNSTNDYPALVPWAREYCRGAIIEDLVLDVDESDPSPDEAISTIRLIADVYTFNNEPEWLETQVLGGPQDKEDWFVLDRFDEPRQWANGTLYIKNLWAYAFSQLFMAAGQSSLGFCLAAECGGAITSKDAKEWACAIVDGMNWDFDADDYRIFVTRYSDCLAVGIVNARSTDASHQPDRDGLIWLKPPERKRPTPKEQ